MFFPHHIAVAAAVDRISVHFENDNIYIAFSVFIHSFYTLQTIGDEETGQFFHVI